MSTEENKAIVRRLLEEHYGSRNEAVLEEVFAPDLTMHIAGQGWETLPGRGPEAYRSDIRALWYSFPDFSVSLEQMIAEGDKVVAVLGSTGTQQRDFRMGPAGVIKSAGKRVNVPYIMVFRISEGRIAETWESTNFGTILQQLGAIPSPTS